VKAVLKPSLNARTCLCRQAVAHARRQAPAAYPAWTESRGLRALDRSIRAEPDACATGVPQ
jgi:hypothetical protein